MLGDAWFAGTMPMVLGSPGARRVPLIGVCSSPLYFLSKDTAPFGSGLPSQGEEKNKEMNAGVTEMLSGVRTSLESTLASLGCIKPLPHPNPLHAMGLGHDVFLQLCIPALEPPRTDLRPDLRFIGAVSGANDQQSPPAWFEDFIVNDKSDRPLVMVSSGTLPDISANELIIPTIEACRAMPVRLVVCAVHTHKPVDFELPDNCRWAEWIPFELLFRYTSVVVTNGGYGGINQAFASGIPMIVAGVTEDKAETSARAEMTGAAINLKTQTPSKEQLCQALQTMLSTGTYREKAKELQAAYRAHDALGSVVQATNEQVVRFYGSGTSKVDGVTHDEA